MELSWYEINLKSKYEHYSSFCFIVCLILSLAWFSTMVREFNSPNDEKYFFVILMKAFVCCCSIVWSILLWMIILWHEVGDTLFFLSLSKCIAMNEHLFQPKYSHLYTYFPKLIFTNKLKWKKFTQKFSQISCCILVIPIRMHFLRACVCVLYFFYLFVFCAPNTSFTCHPLEFIFLDEW